MSVIDNTNVLIDDINSTPSPIGEIKFSIDYADLKNDAFLERLRDNFDDYIGDFKDMIRERNMYEECPDLFPNECNTLKLYELSKNIEDPDLKMRVEYTAIYQFFKECCCPPYPPTYIDESGGKTIVNYNQIMKYLEQKYCPVVFHDIFYVYINNQYYEDRFKKIRKDVDRLLKESGKFDKTKISSIIDEIVQIAKTRWQKYGEDTIFNKVAGIIPVKNGVICLNEDILLLPNSPAWGYTYCLPVIFNPEADKTDIIHFIEGICSENGVKMEEKEDLLIQIPAQALMQQTALPAYLLTGGGRNGKSTYLNLIEGFVGKENHSSVSLQALSHDKFKAAELYGRLFNICADIPRDAVNDTGVFKMLTGNDTLTAERKFGQPFRFKNRAVLVFSANELPHVDDNTFAFWKRWNLIEFKNVFQEDEDFIDNLLSENNKSAFLTIVLDKIKDIRDNGLITNKKSEEIMEQWKMRSNSSYAYLKQYIEKGSNDYVISSLLYAEYCKYCHDNDTTEMSRIGFRKELDKMYTTMDTFIIKDRERIRVVKGIRLKNITENEK